MVDLLAVAAKEIDASEGLRAEVGRTAGTASSLVGWGRRPLAGQGWYLDVRGDAVRLVYVRRAPAQVRVAQRQGGAAPPVPSLTYVRGDRGAPEEGWMTPEQVAGMVALPDADGALLAHLLPDDGAASDTSGRDELRRLVAGCASDPIFLVGALVCEQVPATWPAPVHEGQLGPQRVAALRSAQKGYELVLAVGEATIGAGGRWGGPATDIARRIADVMLARYPTLVPRVASDALTRTIDRGALPVMPAVVTDEPWADELVVAIWAAWAFGPRATVAQGRDLVRRTLPDATGAELDRALVWQLVNLQLSARSAAPSPERLQAG